MSVAKHSIRDVMDGTYGFGEDYPSVGAGNILIGSLFINSSERLVSIENIVTGYRDTILSISAADPQNPTNTELQDAGDDAIDVLSDGLGNLPHGHNIETSSANLTTYGRTNGQGSNQPPEGLGFKHYYHTAQFNKQTDISLDIISADGVTTADFAFGGSQGTAGYQQGAYKQADLEFSEFRDYFQQEPLVSTTLPGCGGLAVWAFVTSIVDNISPTGYPHFDALTEGVDTSGPIGIGGYADGVFIPGVSVDPQYI